MSDIYKNIGLGGALANKNQIKTDGFGMHNNSVAMRQVFSPKKFTDVKGHKKIDTSLRVNHNMRMRNSTDNQIFYDRLYSVYPEKELDGLCQYVFMVRPDTNIFSSDKELTLSPSCEKNAFLRYMCAMHPKILLHLSSNLTTYNDFMPYLVGKTESLQIPDYTIKNYSLNQPYTNLLIPYGGSGLESMTGGTFDVTFREDNEFLIHKLFQAWLTYISGLTKNTIVPKKKHIDLNKIDYATSVYCITCAADGETILYWSKYTGAFPITNPNSDLSFNLRGSVPTKVTIPFAYFLCETMEPFILSDFNKNSHVANPSKDSAPIYNNEAFGTGYGLVGCPYIYRKDKFSPYILKWKDSTDIEPFDYIGPDIK